MSELVESQAEGSVRIGFPFLDTFTRQLDTGAHQIVVVDRTRGVDSCRRTASCAQMSDDQLTP